MKSVQLRGTLPFTSWSFLSPSLSLILLILLSYCPSYLQPHRLVHLSHVELLFYVFLTLFGHQKVRYLCKDILMMSGRFFRAAFQAWISETKRYMRRDMGCVCTPPWSCSHGQLQSLYPPSIQTTPHNQLSLPSILYNLTFDSPWSV